MCTADQDALDVVQCSRRASAVSNRSIDNLKLGLRIMLGGEGAGH
jgi:hypothetical protein